MADEDSATLPRSSNPVPAKRPTIIRAVPRSGTTNSDEDNSNQCSNTSTVDTDPQPADNSDIVNRKPPPARPSAGPSRQSSATKPPARPASVHIRDAPPRLTHRPTSVHLPLTQPPSINDKPTTTSKPQKKRPEITIVSSRPLSEVAGFAKGSDSPTVPQSAVKPRPSTATPTPVTAGGESAAIGAADRGVTDPIAAPRRGVASNADPRKSPLSPVENRSAHPGVTGTTDMSGAPPPLPTNRPKGPYVPPPLPSSRPKGAYVHPGSVSSSSVAEGKDRKSELGRQSAEPTPVPTPVLTPVPKPRPRSVGADLGETREAVSQAAPCRPPPPVTQNRVSEESPKPPSPVPKPGLALPTAQPSKPEAANKPHVKAKLPTPVERPAQAPKVPPHIPQKPAEKPVLPPSSAAAKPVEKPPLPHPVPPPKPTPTGVSSEKVANNQTPADLHKHSEAPPAPKPAMPLIPPASGTKYSRADILSLFDSTYQKNPKPESGENPQMRVAGAVAKNVSTEDTLRFGSVAASAAASDKTRSKNEVDALRFGSAVAQNTTTQDVNNISGGMQMLGQSEDGKKAASSFTRIARSTASDVKSSDTSSGDLKWQVGSSVAKNVSADDAKNIGKAGVTLAKSEQGRKAASSIFNIAKASMSQVNQTQPQSAPAPAPTARTRPKNSGQQGGPSLGSLMGLMPPPKAQPATKPSATAAGSKPSPVPKFKIASDTTSLPRAKPTIIRPGAEKPGSKPNSRNSSPETRRKVPPPRPSTGPQVKSKGSAPSRPSAPHSQPKSTSSANLRPKRHAPLKPGIPNAKKSSLSDSLPPRPGPGHPLYNKYMDSEPHGIALYDYKPIQKDELGFKANDVIILLNRIDADWLRGRCGNAEGLLPAAFLKIVKDVPQTGNKPSTSDPCAVAVYSFEGSAVDELYFQKGDTIVLLDRVGDQWYQGQCKGRTGIFPANHVDVIEDLPVKAAASSSDIASGPRCKAKFDYDSSNPEDLTFKQGDVIRLVENVGAQWLKGQLGTKTGIFPESFVDVIEGLPAAAKTSSIVVNGNSGNKVTALFDFEAAESNEISFEEGDKITILSQVSSDWLHGELRNGCRGNLPSAFVDHIPANLPSFTTNDSPSEIGEFIVKFDFEPVGEGEVALKAGDRVTVLEYVGDDWMKGRVGSKEGIFPKTFVEMVGKGETASAMPSLGTCKVMYDFIGDEPGELTIKYGDVIEILEHVSADWLRGRLNSKTGMFPKAFVDIR